MKSQDRLTTMSREIGPEDRVVDIGSDHGYLPLLLLKEKKCSKVIVTDISPWSLKKAKRNIEREFPGDQCHKKVSFRLGNGFDVISSEEANIAVIGGMGGLLISEILFKHIDISLGFDKIIMQPRKNSGELRYWLYNNGFTIINECLAKEGRFICEIIVAKKSKDKWNGPLWSLDTKISYQIPRQILQAEEELVRVFLDRKLEQEKTVKNALVNIKNSDPRKKDVLIKRIQYVEDLIKEFDEKSIKS